MTNHKEGILKGKLKIIEDNKVSIYCPGCECDHEIPISGASGPVWRFNGNYDKPTLTPSILVRTGHYTGKENVKYCWCTYAKDHPDEEIPYKCGICHSYITDGKIQYLGDCTHKFVNQIINL